jgi:hypothetical protein
VSFILFLCLLFYTRQCNQWYNSHLEVHNRLTKHNFPTTDTKIHKWKFTMSSWAQIFNSSQLTKQVLKEHLILQKRMYRINLGNAYFHTVQNVLFYCPICYTHFTLNNTEVILFVILHWCENLYNRKSLGTRWQAESLDLTCKKLQEDGEQCTVGSTVAYTLFLAWSNQGGWGGGNSHKT